MTAVAPANSTYAMIEQKIRRLTASAAESVLASSDIQQYVNTFYSQDFPFGIKIDQMRSVYTFYTTPYVDRYPLDVNFNQGIRAPVYVDGIQGSYFKDRQQFFALWPRFPTQFQQAGDATTGAITAILQPSNPTQITSANHGLITGAIVYIQGVQGMTELNDQYYQITFIDANTFSLNGIDDTSFGAYTGGGTWLSISQNFSFTIPAPFLSYEVTIGGVDQDGNPISIRDDGNGNIQIMSTNAVTYNPAANSNPAYPGMYNTNTGNPGLINPTNIGTVDYVSGLITFTLPIGTTLANGTLFTVWVSQYQTGRPYSLLFWNNMFIVRPVPKLIHKFEVETFLTPVQFMTTNDVPILNQWWQYIAYGAAMEILRDRQDMEGVENLREGMKRQEALVLERQCIEEIFQPNPTIFNSVTPAVGGVNGIGYYV